MKTTLAAALAFLFLGCSSPEPREWTCFKGTCYKGEVTGCDDVKCTYQTEAWCYLGRDRDGSFDQDCSVDAKRCQISLGVYLDMFEGRTILDRCARMD